MASVERVESSQIKRAEALCEPAAPERAVHELTAACLIAPKPRKPQSSALSG
jgi:hypothetical protein